MVKLASLRPSETEAAGFNVTDLTLVLILAARISCSNRFRWKHITAGSLLNTICLVAGCRCSHLLHMISAMRRSVWSPPNTRARNKRLSVRGEPDALPLHSHACTCSHGRTSKGRILHQHQYCINTASIAPAVLGCSAAHMNLHTLTRV